MRRIVLDHASRPYRHRSPRRIGCKRNGKLEVFVRAINKELEEMGRLITELDDSNSRDLPGKR